MTSGLPRYSPLTTTAVLLGVNTVLYMAELAWSGCVPNVVPLALAVVANLVLVQVLSASRLYNIAYTALCCASFLLFGFLSLFFPVLLGLRWLAHTFGLSGFC